MQIALEDGVYNSFLRPSFSIGFIIPSPKVFRSRGITKRMQKVVLYGQKLEKSVSFKQKDQSTGDLAPNKIQ